MIVFDFENELLSAFLLIFAENYDKRMIYHRTNDF